MSLDSFELTELSFIGSTTTTSLLVTCFFALCVVVFCFPAEKPIDRNHDSCQFIIVIIFVEFMARRSKWGFWRDASSSSPDNTQLCSSGSDIVLSMVKQFSLEAESSPNSDN